MNSDHTLAQSHDIATKVALVFRKRAEVAQQQFSQRLAQAADANEVRALLANPAASVKVFTDLASYAVDATQRMVLFWDTIRRRGNDYNEHTQAGLPPVLHFGFETVVDGRKLARPVNYALVRIIAPDGVTIDPKRRPYVIIDPRAGHGPGIGGFKDDSQVGVAIREGHPVYFVIFFRDPEPGQTLIDVCEAEKQFVRKVRELHPDSPKPAIVGNCQGGWAAMMLAASHPGDAGPIVINGAPMSYWGGAWQAGGPGDNPMRYSGGMLGGTWLSSFASDLGGGIFDGAHLVENFEKLNPANTFWDKYYHLYANVDTEPPRFLEFERWWGGFYLMNREEIEWITRNLFVGNKVWKGQGAGPGGQAFDLRNIKSPIVLFASMGDNITPPQQAFNWVADVYGSTDEIKARGQVIVGLMHEDVGHLGIFVSGKVAKKEHTQIVSVLQSIEALAPGLYAMKIAEHKRNGTAVYEVSFEERSLEDIVARLNRFEREDEKPFQAVDAVSDFNQRAYELFLQPMVQATFGEFAGRLQRQFHPLRMQRWAFSDLNPWLNWLAPAASAVRSKRAPVEADNAVLKMQQTASTAISASLDYYRAMRDATSEAAFFLTYGNVFSLYIADKHEAKVDSVAEPRDLPFVQEALASIGEGGYPEALARAACLLARRGEPLLLSRLQMRRELIDEYRHLLPAMPQDQWRRIRGEQEIIVRYAPDEALATLPRLLRSAEDRTRLVTLVRALLADERVQRAKPTNEQLAMIEDIGESLSVERSTPVERKALPRVPRKSTPRTPRKAARKTARARD